MEIISGELSSLLVLEKNTNLFLVALAVVIAIISAFSAFSVTEHISRSQQTEEKLLWTLLAGSTMAIGTWACHFIAILALQLPVEVTYNPVLTFFSLLPILLSSILVLWLITQYSFNILILVLTGTLLAIGIISTHYIGILAMQLNANIVYSAQALIFSLIIPPLFTSAALFSPFKNKQNHSVKLFDKKYLNSALLMGFAVAGTHFLAINVISFVKTERLLATETVGLSATLLAVIITTIVFVMLLLTITIPLLLKYQQVYVEMNDNAETTRITATAFNTHEGIIITDKKSRIIRVNDAFSRITGFSENDVRGKNIRGLKSKQQNNTSQQDIWSQLFTTGEWEGESWNRRKEGEVYPVRETITAVYNDNNETTHYLIFFSDITKAKQAEHEIERLAFYDPLTDLPNRRLLHDSLEKELKIADTEHCVGALLFIDLDRFKNINDSLGHSVGDELLKETANRIKKTIYKRETRKKPLAVRLGGDEFVILVPAKNKPYDEVVKKAETLSKKLIQSINRPYLFNHLELYISPSIGITLFSGKGETIEMLLKQADTAMYSAKDNGRNTFVFYQQSMQEEADARLLLERHLRNALDNEELSLVYQPQISAAKNTIIGLEALIRWNSPELGFISPVEFIPLAEETGLIIEIGQWILRTVCRQIKVWDALDINIPHVAVNISPHQFHQASFVAMVCSVLSQEDIKTDRVMLEITEGVFLKDIDEAIDKMKQLKDKGFFFSIDDFGTGYSSLTYLKHLPFDQLKIDQAFVRELTENLTDLAIVKAIILMAESLDLSVIAEGVETQVHLKYLTDLGCDHIQGYYYSKPLTVNDVDKFYKKLKYDNM